MNPEAHARIEVEDTDDEQYKVVGTFYTEGYRVVITFAVFTQIANARELASNIRNKTKEVQVYNQ